MVLKFIFSIMTGHPLVEAQMYGRFQVANNTNSKAIPDGWTCHQLVRITHVMNFTNEPNV